MSKIIGIDLGTTNSRVAVMEGGRATVIPNAEGDRTTPSVVAFSKTGERMVGQAAKRQAITDPDRTVLSIKREMGSGHKIKIDGRACAPQEISAMVLRKLKADAEAYLSQNVSKAVIAVPACFTSSQRQAVKDAGRIAGLEVERIISEPTAAALAYGMDKEEDQKIIVCDLGGGFFEVSILEVGGGVIQALATAGSDRLGGGDFDRCVMDWMVETFRRTEGIDLSGSKIAMARLREAAEKAKIELSSVASASIRVLHITTAADGQTTVEANILQGEQQMAADNKSLGRLRLDGIAPAQRGVPQIEVTFDIDADGIVNVSARDLGTGNEQRVTLTSSANMSEEEIQRAVQEAEQYAAEDAKRQESAGQDSRLAELEDQLLRLATEYDNYRRRTAKEKEKLYQDARSDTIARFLEVYDNLERAVRQAGGEENVHKKGMEMIFRQLEGVLTKLGVEILDPLGQPFDPERHNAVMHIDDKSRGEGVVTAVFQKGFLLGDRVLRCRSPIRATSYQERLSRAGGPVLS